MGRTRASRVGFDALVKTIFARLSVIGVLTDARESACAPHCSLEIGRSGLGGDGKPWRIGTEVYGDRDILPRDVISRKLSVPNAERIFFIRHALRAGFTIEEIFNLTKIDRWFLVQIKEIVDFEEELAGAKN